ncbi:MAG: hypothetical protein KAU49_07190 [Candidatus Krumholzibacteria bacterium]|nr:hypothetical protein [Candidatus Krumholzibacteria bacterium]
MRPLSGFSDVLIAVLLLAVASCASAPPASSSREPFQLEGSIRVEGDQPFNRVIVLSDAQGIRWNLDPGDLEAELSLLDGYDVLLTCSGIPGKGGVRDALVESYVLVPPDGMIALQGSISIDDESIILNVDGRRHRLNGPLTAALETFGDHRAWVWGISGDGDTIEISGYEVLGP